MVKLGLKGKLIFVISGILLLAGGIGITLVLRDFVSVYKKNIIERVFLRASILKESLEKITSLGVPLKEIKGVDEECKKIVEQIPYGVYCFITDKEGRVYYHNRKKEKGTVYKDGATLKSLKANKRLVRHLCFDKKSCVYDFSLPLYDNKGNRQGAIRIGVLTKIVDEGVKGIKQRYFLLYAIFVFFVIISIAFFNKAFVINPLQLILKGLNRFSGGELTYRIKLGRKDEFGKVADSINRIEELLLASQEKIVFSKTYLESIIENISDSLVVTDAKKRINMVNSVTLNLLGYTKEEIITSSIEKIMSKEILDAKRMEILLEKGILRNLDVEYLTKGKEKIPVVLSIILMWIGDKEKTQRDFMLLFIAQDVQRIKSLVRRVEEADFRLKKEQEVLEEKISQRTKDLRESQEAILNILEDLAEAKEDIEISRRTFLNIIEKSYEGIVVVNRKGEVLFANSVLCELFGISKSNILGSLLGFPCMEKEMMEVDIIPQKGEVTKRAEMRIVEVEWKGEEAYLILLHDITERINFEETLKRVAEEWRSTFDSMLDGVVLLNKEGRILRANKAFKDILGLSYREMKGKEFFEIFIPHLKLKEKLFTKTLETKEHQSYECKYNERQLLITLDPLLKEGVFKGVICIIADITEEKNAKEEAKLAYWSKTIINEIVKLSFENISLKEILERSLYSLVSFPWLSVKPKGAIFLADNKNREFILSTELGLPYLKEIGMRIPFDNICGNSVSEGKPLFIHSHSEEEKCEYGEGEKHTHFCFIIGYGGKYDEENIRGMLMLYSDYGKELVSITREFFLAVSTVLAEIIEFKRTQEELISTKVFIENILESAQSAIYVLDKEGAIISVNRFAEEFLGYSRKEIIGKKWYESFILEEDKEKAREVCNEIARGKKTKGFEVAVKTRDNKKVILSWDIAPLKDNEDRVMGAVALGYDVTEKKEMEKSQRLAQLGKLVADMAHEVNNPLMVISGRAQLSLMEEIQNEEIKNNLNIIIKECQRAKDIIQRLLKFSRPSKGEFREININHSLEEVISLVEHQFSLANISIIREFEANLPLIRGDEKQLQEVFMNLFNNARDVMPEGGHIKIKTSLVPEGIKIEIKDSGYGMDKEMLEKAFDPFFTTKEKGTGLGLAVCYSIIKHHKGEMWFESILGEGTTAVIILPIKGDENV